MDEYTMQSYFKALSNAYCIAYEQIARLSKSSTKDNKRQRDFWSARLKQTTSLILEVMDEIQYNNYKIIITDEKEIIAIMGYYYTHFEIIYGIINEREEELKAFPKGELGRKFLKAYMNRNKTEMEELIKQYFI